MIVTLTNSSATSPGGDVTLNALRSYNGATGGTLQVALPYPFNADGGSAVPVQFPYAPIVPGGTLTLPMHEQDWMYKRVPWETSFPFTDWNFLINAGIVSLAFTAEANVHVAALSTTITSGSNGLSLPQATINAVTTGFPTSGYIGVTTSAGVQSVYYTGTTGTAFTGCVGGTGQMATGGAIVTYGHGIVLGDIEDLFITTL